MKRPVGWWWKGCLLGVGALALRSTVSQADGPTAPAPPTSRTVDVVDEIHGVSVADPYRWLEKESDPEVQAWLGAQRAYARSRLDHFPRREALARRFEELFSLTTVSCPEVHRRRYLFSKSEGRKNHAVHYVRERSCRAPARVILDPNTWSEDGTVALDWMKPSPDASLIAYGKSASGSEKSTLYVLEVATGNHLPDEIPNTRHCSIAWDPDLRGFLYTRFPQPGTVPPGDEYYYCKVYHHRLGSDWRSDPVVVGDLVKKEESIGIWETSDHRYVMLSRSVDWGKNDLFFRRAGCDEPFRPISVGHAGAVSADTYGDKLIIHTNIGAPRYRLALAPIDHCTLEYWKEVIPEQKGVIRGFSIVGGRLLATVTENVRSRLFVYDLRGKLIEEIELPAPGTVSKVNGEPDGKEAFFGFESFAYPPANFRYEVDSGRLEKLDQTEVNIDLSQYLTRQVWYESKDGTRVPMFVTHRKGLNLDGDNPTVLYGYGGFDIGRYPEFDARRIPWLDAGGVYVVANIRGGAEFGRQWHEAGRREKKQNVFDDFIAAAEKLIDLKYTSPQRLAISGGSNGGLLVGACMTQRPELFQAVVCAVPLLDMVRYHHFQMARFWVSEYGSAEEPEQFKWLYAYSPYHHVRRGVDYPATLLMTAESDSRVQPMHAYKMVAALQAATSGSRPILLRVEKKAGHGYARKPLWQRVEEQADLWTFLMWQLGMIES